MVSVDERGASVGLTFRSILNYSQKRSLLADIYIDTYGGTMDLAETKVPFLFIDAGFVQDAFFVEFP